MCSASPKRSNCSEDLKGKEFMSGKFALLVMANQRGKLSRVVAGVWVALWMAGFLSTLHVDLTQRLLTSHCPQPSANSMHHPHGSCAWHCDNIATQASSGRSWGPAITPTGFLSKHLSATGYVVFNSGGSTSRGPPSYS